LIFQKNLAHLIFKAANLDTILIAAGIWMIVGAFLQVGLAVLRAQERIFLVSTRELFTTLWLIGSVYFAYLMDLDLIYLIMICTVGDLVMLIWVLFQIGTPIPITRLSKSLKTARRLLQYAFPLILNTLFLWFTRSIDKIMIVYLLSLSVLGAYGVALQLSTLLMIVMSPINFVLFPMATASWNKQNKGDVNRYFSQSVLLTIVLSAPIMAGLLIVFNDLIALLAGPGYRVGKLTMLFLILSEFARAIYQNHIYVIHLVEKTGYLPILFISTATINTAVCYALVAYLKIGIAGAACARFITFAFMAFTITVWARKYIEFDIAWKTILLVIFSTAIMTVSIFWMPMHTWLQMAATIFSGAIVFLTMLFSLRVITVDKLIAFQKELGLKKNASTNG
jgi:O-antigen/teichoic acid export membrane protein